MITGSEIYWITRMDGIRGFFIGSTIILGVCLVFSVGAVIFSYAPPKEDWRRKVAMIGVINLLLFLFSSTAAILTPSTKEMCAIKVIPAIANNENVQELPNKIVELANEWIEELKPKKGDKK